MPSRRASPTVAASRVEAVPHRRRERPAAPRRVGREQEQRQDEDDEPRGREGAGDAVAFALRRIEAEQRRQAEIGGAGLRARRQEAEHDDERDEPAGVAGRPAGAGQAAEPLGRHELQHHGVVEHRRHFDRDRRDGEGDERQHDPVRRAGRCEPQGRRGDDQHGAGIAAIHGFRGPLASAMLPSTGESTASVSPAAAVA